MQKIYIANKDKQKNENKNKQQRSRVLEGNIISPEWHYYVTGSNGKPDHVSIVIIAELMMGYTKDGCRYFYYGYRYFRAKFNYSRHQIRCAFTRLEQKKLIQRKYKTVKIEDRTFNNQLFLIFYPENLTTLATEFDGSNNKNFQILQEMQNIKNTIKDK